MFSISLNGLIKRQLSQIKCSELNPSILNNYCSQTHESLFEHKFTVPLKLHSLNYAVAFKCAEGEKTEALHMSVSHNRMTKSNLNLEYLNTFWKPKSTLILNSVVWCVCVQHLHYDLLGFWSAISSCPACWNLGAHLPVVLQISNLLSQLFQSSQRLRFSQLHPDQLFLQPRHIGVIW